jgi:tetratricopeptide (TPR) repeat protein
MAPNFRTCPQCSTRNRLDKEFCVKCGEPLEGVKAGDQTVVGPAKGKPGIVLTESEEAQSPLVAIVVILLTIGVGFAAWRTIAAEPPTLPQAAVRPKEGPPPAVATPSTAPGAREYAEGLAALNAGDYPNAIRLLRLAVAAANRADYMITLADALEKSGASADAIAQFEAAFNRENTSARYAAEWAKALYRAGRFPEAIRAYEAALRIDGDNLNNLREVIDLYKRAGTPALARPFLERLVALQPEDLVPRQELARALEAANDLPAAIAQYQAILAVMPNADLSRAYLSEIYMQQNRSDSALQLLDEGLTANPNAALLHREKGRILDRLGNDEAAVAAYREYVRLAPAAADVRIFATRIEQLSGSGS